MVRSFDHCLQFLTRVKSHHAASGDRNLFTGLGVSPRPLRLFAQLEISETRELHAVAGLQRNSNFFEETLDHVLRFALVEPELLEQQIGEFGFRECHWSPPEFLLPQRATKSTFNFSQQYCYGCVD